MIDSWEYQAIKNSIQLILIPFIPNELFEFMHSFKIHKPNMMTSKYTKIYIILKSSRI